MGLLHSPLSPTDGLVLCLDTANKRSYPGSGATWFDLSGNGYNGTLIGGASYNGIAMNFDGLDDYVTYSVVAPNLTNTFCISGWFKANAINQTNTYIISSTSTGNENTWSVIYGYVLNNLEFYVGAGRYSGSDPRSGSQILINDTNWHFFAYNYNGSIWSGWKDNQLIFSVSRTFSLTGTSTGLFLATYSSSLSRNLNGQIGDIRVYNRALNATEIRALFNAKRRRFGV